ncbi:MAG TPA: head GIN domain-containing protein [Bacteroidales bacterium]|nr:head GIN domain-containing protein [Bacteroidales bacterium]
MKSLRNLATLLALAVGFISCVDGQFYHSVRGNGNVVKKERTMSGFDAVKVSSGIDVYLSQGDKESVTVEADENLHDYIVTEVRNGVLNVYTDNVSIRHAERERVYVTIKDVKSLRTSSAGDIVGETPIKCGDIEISASSSGDITLELHADKVDVDISSAGDIKLNGDAQSLRADLSSAGSLKAYDFKVKEADVSVSSAGDADIYASDKLMARASSAGDIHYMGSPKYVDAHSSSAGGIHSR